MKYFAGSSELVLDKELGKGGEGVVYSVRGTTATAVKLFHPGKVGERKNKIIAIANSGIASKLPEISLPQNVVTDGKGAFAGFVMNRVQNHKPLHSLYGPESRKKNFPRANFKFLLRAAKNTAVLVSKAHAHGLIIGDINHSSILYSDDAKCTFIDADSFQFKLNGHLYPCLVGTAEYLAPELQGNVQLSDASRTTDQDCFALAVVIFRLLAAGKHPYTGTFKNGNATTDENIKSHRFVYTKKSNVLMTPPPAALSLDDFPSYIADLFERSFSNNTSRPSADDWIRMLSNFESHLVTCNKSSSHHISPGARRCAWCFIESITKKPFFPTEIAQPKENLPTAVSRIWESIQSIKLESEPAIGLFAVGRFGTVTSQELATYKRMLEKYTIQEGILENEYKKFMSTNGFDNIKSSCLKLAIHYKEQFEKYNIERKTPDLKLNTYFIRDHKIVGIGPVRLSTLISYGVETAADVEEQRLMAIPGFGQRIIQPVLAWRDGIKRGIAAKNLTKPDENALLSNLTKKLKELEAIKYTQKSHLIKLQKARKDVAMSKAEYEEALSASKRSIASAPTSAPAPAPAPAPRPTATPKSAAPRKPAPAPKPIAPTTTTKPAQRPAPQPVPIKAAPRPMPQPSNTTAPLPPVNGGPWLAARYFRKFTDQLLPATLTILLIYFLGYALEKTYTQPKASSLYRGDISVDNIDSALAKEEVSEHKLRVELNSDELESSGQGIKNLPSSDDSLIADEFVEVDENNLETQPISVVDNSAATSRETDSIKYDARNSGSEQNGTVSWVETSKKDFQLNTENSSNSSGGFYDSIGREVTDDLNKPENTLDAERQAGRSSKEYSDDPETREAKIDRAGSVVSSEKPRLNDSVPFGLPRNIIKNKKNEPVVEWSEQVSTDSSVEAMNNATDLNGVWNGTYSCGGNSNIPLVLKVKAVVDNEIEVELRFSSVEILNDGIIILTGSVNELGLLALKPRKWINRLPGYQMFGLSGKYQAGKDEIAGIIEIPTCKGFEVFRQR